VTDDGPEERRRGGARGLDEWLRLAEGLRRAHAAVARAVMDASTRKALTRRLLAITNAAKHDVGTASRRLDSFFPELRRALARDEKSRSDEENDATQGRNP